MITVYDMHAVYDRQTGQNDFLYNGLAVLSPYSAYTTEELNGSYAFEIEVPCIPDDPRPGRDEDTWKCIKMYNILKNSFGQLFQIYKLQYFTRNGVPFVKAWANHIWYYLADMLTLECQGQNNRAWQVVNHLFEPRNAEGHGCTWFSGGTGLTSYEFDKYIDPELELNQNPEHKYNYRNVQLANALLGNSDSIVNVWGGEIYRDNFYFRIDKRKWDAVDDAFELVYGVNCTDVKYTPDTLNRKTEIHASCNNGKYPYVKSIIPDAGLFPHQAISGLDFSYEEPSYEVLIPDVDDWWSKNTGWLKTWEVQYVDFRKTNLGEGWDQTRRIRVGDKGRVRDAFGNSDTQLVIQTKYNDLTGRLESLKLGQFIDSGLHRSRWDKKIMKTEDEPVMKRVRCIERELGTDITNIAGSIQNINNDIGDLNSDVGDINNSINDINAAIQDIYSKLPNP